jgi:hypothetical protein
MQFSVLARSQHYERGLKWFRRWFVCEPSDYTSLNAELNAMPEAVRAVCVKEMRALYYACSSMEKSGDNRNNGTSRVDAMSVPYLVKSLQQLILASPLYGVYMNPDFGVELPARIPLLAFDLQSVRQPLNVTESNRLLSNILKEDTP